jgi:2,3-bisphosphoglycerate-dependent phosphoglycerate mutase
LPLVYRLDAGLAPFVRGGSYLDPDAATVEAARVAGQGR